MLKLALTLLVAPSLVGASTLAARRWGQRLGGLVSAFPAIAFAVLLIDAHERGAEFAARAASATLLGLLTLTLTLSVFVVAFGRTARRAGWPQCLLAGWVVGGILTALPVLASILAVFTLAQHGAPALQDLLRGMVSGMAAFVVVCALVAVLVQPAGIATAFAAAVLGALAAQAAMAWSSARGIPLAT